MRLLLAIIMITTWTATATAFDSLEIPKEAVRVDTMHPVPELRGFSLVEEKDMACMQDMAIAQCTRKVYSNAQHRLMVVAMGGAPTYYWYFDPASKKVSTAPIEGTTEESWLTKDKAPGDDKGANAGDFFSNANKQGSGSIGLFKF